MPAAGEMRRARLARCGTTRQGLRDMMPILSLMEVGRNRPQLCARESSPLAGDVS
jgi:hypothetical protein